MTATSSDSPYDVGDLVTVYGEFKNTAGVLVDPTTVVCKVKTAAGVETTYTYGIDVVVVKDAVGKYHLDISIPNAVSSAGTWSYRWRSTGTGQAAEEASFDVEESAFASP